MSSSFSDSSPFHSNIYFRGSPRIKNLVDKRHMEMQNFQTYTPAPKYNYKTTMHMDAPQEVPIQKLWLDDPGVLVRQPLNILPYAMASPIERVNSATRAVLLVTGIMSMADGSSTPIMHGLIAVVLFSLYFSDQKADTLSVVDMNNVGKGARVGGVSTTRGPIEQEGPKTIRDLMNGPQINFQQRTALQTLNM